MEKILVIGGTGMVGSAVARRLQYDGYDVKIMDHNINSAQDIKNDSIGWGDVLDPSSIEKALWGCSAIHISISEDVEEEGVNNIVSVAARVGIERITYTSGTNVTKANMECPVIKGKLQAEKAIINSGIPYTIFRPTYFMENLPRFIQGHKAYVFGKEEVLYHLVALDDYARIVSKSYVVKEAENRIFHIHGPQAITMKDALETFCLAKHPEVSKVSVMPFWRVKLMAALKGNDRMKAAAELGQVFAKIGELGEPSAANLLFGAPEFTLEDWIYRNDEDRPNKSKGRTVLSELGLQPEKERRELTKAGV